MHLECKRMTFRTIVMAVFLTISILVNGQSISINGDGSAPDVSAMLDVVATDKGLLIPRMTEAQKNAITNPATSLIIYQTDGTEGFYFNVGTPGTPSWIRLTSTVDSTTPVALADADDDTKVQVEEGADDDFIRFDMAGTEFFRMDSGRIDVLNTGSSVYMGQNAGLNDDLSATRGNTAIGWNALNANETGASNTAIGIRALQANTSSSSTSVGAWSFYQNTGQRNVGLGASAGFGNLSGEGNVFLGWQAGSANTGSNNVFLGKQAGAAETGSDKLYIENSNTNQPLIYGDFANDSLKVFGSLSIGNAFTLPSLDGAFNTVLRTDGAGNLSWVSMAAASSVWNQPGSDINYIAGNVGIGTNSPDNLLHIQDGALKIENTGTGSGYNNLMFLSNSTNQSFIVRYNYDAASSIPDSVWQFRSSGSNSKGFVFSKTDGTLLMSLGAESTSGRIGIGLNNPTSRLEVDGDLEIDGNGAVGDDAFYFGDPATDGSWRIVRDGNDLSFERREAGVWNFKMKLNP